ncbi:MAG: hypothetical protein ACRDSK_16750, partial [Actinophytocola sp.]|uniref:hypothetical protein n=1 Tax=Actinophytocola sp. TaxID=1872138 RepID=UPI003D6A7928
AGAGSAAAAVAAIGIAMVVVLATSGTGGSGSPVGAPPTTSEQPTGGEPSKTDTSWPNGQPDRTARNGPEFDNGQALLAALTEVVPEGYDAPEDLSYEEPGYSGGPLRFSQASYEDTVDGQEVWRYLADQPITKGNGVGRMFVETVTPGNGAAGEGCALSPTLWGMEGECTEQVVGGERIGVFTATGDRRDFHSWAGYLADDGTVVYVAQGRDYPGSGRPALATAPLSAEQLAELAADPRFRLD